MKNKLLLLIVLFFSKPLLAADSWPPSHLKCGEYAKGIKLSGEIKKDDLLKLLHPKALFKSSDEVELVCALGTKEWKAGKGQIAVLETQNFKKNNFGGSDSGLAHIYLATIESPLPGQGIKLREQLSEPVELKTDREELESIDTAAYQMTEGHYAFGIRTITFFAYSGGGGSNSYLMLFHSTEKQISPILRTLVASSSTTAGDTDPDGTRDQSENEGGTAIIRVAKTQTSGMNDFDKIVKGKKSNHEMKFVWNGKTYSSKDKEPIQDVNDN